MRKVVTTMIMLIAALAVAGCATGKGKSPIGKGKGKTPVVQTRG